MFRKKYIFFWGSYFYGYKTMVIKARTEANAVVKFLRIYKLEVPKGWKVQECRYNEVNSHEGSMSR